MHEPLFHPDVIEIHYPRRALPAALVPGIAGAGGAVSGWRDGVRIVRLPLQHVDLADALIGSVAAHGVKLLVRFCGDALPPDVDASVAPQSDVHQPAQRALATYRARCTEWWRLVGAPRQAAAIAEDVARVERRRAEAPDTLRGTIDNAIKAARGDGVDDATIKAILASAAAAVRG